MMEWINNVRRNEPTLKWEAMKRFVTSEIDESDEEKTF
jgi:hypothetical protein